MTSSSAIIFHPGSRNLYFGKSSETTPQKIIHAIARRLKSTTTSSTSTTVHKDTIAPISVKKLAEKVPHEVESARLQLSLTLQSAVMNASTDESEKSNPKILTDLSSLVEFNKNVQKNPLSSEPLPAPGISTEFENKAFIVGDDVLKLPPEAPYNIHCPWKRGQLNLHREVGGSITAVIADLEDIWTWCIVEKLKIPQKDINLWRAIVVVPAMFDRVHAKEIMSLLINRLGFEAAYLVQDHICASFGCGISCATVVDVGDQKISVSCVEDGVSYPQSRLELKYGGVDLTIALWNQLRLTSFPLPVDISQQWDMEFLNNLKEKYCHLSVAAMDGVPKEEVILWDKPGEIPANYSVRFGDELLLVPLSYFNPDLLRGSIGRKAVICYGPQPSVYDDPFDRLYLAETSRRCLKDHDDGEEDEGVGSTTDDPKEATTAGKKLVFDLPLGIEQAIVQAIESCNIEEDLKRRLYSCVIIVGGGFKVNGLTKWLGDRVKAVTPKNFITVDSEDPRIVTSVKNTGDPCTTVWKGAAILSSLETAKELWISQKEWTKFGSKVLREKSLFQF